MMPGVVAGVPSKRASTAVLTSVADVTIYGFIKSGSFAGMGAISPVGVRIIPSSAPMEGAAGEILQLLWYAPASSVNPNKLELVVIGEYSGANIPFARATIDGVEFSAAAATLSVSQGRTQMLWNASANPLPAGNRALRFE